MLRITLILFSFITISHASMANIDSLKKCLRVKDLADTTRGNIYQDIAAAYYTTDGTLDSALRYYKLSLKMRLGSDSQSKISMSYAGLGLIYREKGIYDLALINYLNAHKYAIRARDALRMSKALIGIGVVHHIQKDYEKALKYYNEAEELNLKHANQQGVASVYNNKGLLFSDSQNFEKALEFFNKALQINLEVDDKRGVATVCENIGLIYLNHKNDVKRALKKFATSIDIWRYMKDRLSVSITLQYISLALQKDQRYQSSIDTCLVSLKLAVEAKSLSSQMNAHELLYKAYDKMGDPVAAYKHFKTFIGLKDSISSESEIRTIAEIQMGYDYKIKDDLDSIKREVKNQSIATENELKIKKQKEVNNYLIIGSSILLLLTIWIWFVYQRNKKAKKEISAQKLLIEQKNLEVMDSIKYASRIQNAILPPKEQMLKIIPEHFVLYMPKDIVSGDFYWIEEKDDYVFMSVVDCTGHGVPGAFMSIVGRNGLNEAVNVANLKSASAILDFLNKFVNETLHQTYEYSKVRDGMDLALCVWNKKTNTLDFAGANNPVWIIKKNNLNTAAASTFGIDGLLEIDGDKQPIGNFIGQNLRPFTGKTIQAEKGDSVYLFSDGFADQFGGPKGKKLKYKRLKELIVENSKLGIEVQKTILHEFFMDWKGELEQIDDVCIIGVKL